MRKKAAVEGRIGSTSNAWTGPRGAAVRCHRSRGPRMWRGTASAPNAARRTRARPHRRHGRITPLRWRSRPDRLRLDRMPDRQRERVTLLHGSLTYRDKRLAGYDAAAVVEVIEHLDPPRLAAFERVALRVRAPGHRRRHDAERRIQRQVREPARRAASDTRITASSGRGRSSRRGRQRRRPVRYDVALRAVGPDDAEVGAPTQMAVFRAMKPSRFRAARWSCSSGRSGSGKSTFARRHFKPTEVLSSDFCRGLVSDDENDQTATNDAFEVLHFIAAKRLAAGKLTVVDATNVQPEARKPLVALARQYHCLPVAIVLDLPEKVCHERNKIAARSRLRPARQSQQSQQIRRSLRGLEREGFRHVFVLSSGRGDRGGQIDAAAAVEQPTRRPRAVRHHRRRSRLPIGARDRLLVELGYDQPDGTARPSPGRTQAGLRRRPGGSRAEDSWRAPLVMEMVAAGSALCVPGNHEMKLLRKLRGRTSGSRTGSPRRLRSSSASRRSSRQSRCGLHRRPRQPLRPRRRQARRRARRHEGGDAGPRLRARCATSPYGETTGETDEFGLPVRYNWAAEYRGKAMVVYGHTPVARAEWLNSTINIDTGCVFGGRLTALRYPEKELVSVPAERTYVRAGETVPAGSRQTAPRSRLNSSTTMCSTSRTFWASESSTTRLHRTVTVREENAIAALEVMSRFAANPKWLIYLPPTMSPSRHASRRRGCSSTLRRPSPTTATKASRRSSAKRSTWDRAP